MDVSQGLTTLLVIAFIAAIAPLLVGLVPRLHLPQVVVLLVGGVIVGPHVLGWGDPAVVTPFVNLGLGFLSLLAGYELDFGAPPCAGRFSCSSSCWSWPPRSAWMSSSEPSWQAACSGGRPRATRTARGEA